MTKLPPIGSKIVLIFGLALLVIYGLSITVSPPFYVITTWLGPLTNVLFDVGLGGVVFLFVMSYYRGLASDSAGIFLVSVFAMIISTYDIVSPSFVVNTFPASYFSPSAPSGTVLVGAFGVPQTYLAWPTIHFLVMFLGSVLNGSPTPGFIEWYAKIGSLLWVELVVLIGWCFSKFVGVSRENRMLMSILVVLSLWIPYQEFVSAPQAIGYLFYAFVLLSVLILERNTRGRNMNGILVLELFAIATAMTHVYTSAWVGIFILVYYVIVKKRGGIAIMAGGGILVWTLYVFASPYSSTISSFISQLSLQTLFEADYLTKLSPVVSSASLAPQVVDRSRILFLLLIVLFLGFSAGRHLRSIRNWFASPTTGVLTTSLIVSFGMFVLVTYGTETFERVYFFAALPAIALGFYFYPRKPRIPKSILVFFFFALLLFFPARYGQLSFEGAGPPEVNGYSFLATRTPTSTYMLADFPEIWMLNSSFVGSPIWPQEDVLTPNQVPTLPPGSLICESVSEHNRLEYLFSKDIVQNWVVSNKLTLNRYFDNGFLTVYATTGRVSASELSNISKT